MEKIEIPVTYDGETRNYWRFKMEERPSFIISIYVPKEQYPTRPNTVKVVVE